MVSFWGPHTGHWNIAGSLFSTELWKLSWKLLPVPGVLELELNLPLQQPTVDSKKLEHGCSMIYAGFPSFLGLGLEHGPVPTFWISTVVLESDIQRILNPGMYSKALREGSLQRTNPVAGCSPRLSTTTTLHLALSIFYKSPSEP